MKKRAASSSGKKKASGGSKWTPDITIDSTSGRDRDDEIIDRLGSKLGVKDGDAVPEEFVADGLDYLLALPRYGQDAKNAEVKQQRKTASAKAAQAVAAEEEVGEKKASKRDAKERAPKPQSKKAKQEIVEEESDDDEEDSNEEEEEEEEIANPADVMEALKKLKESKKAARPPTEIDAIFSKLQGGKKMATKKTKQDAKAPASGGKDDGFAGRSLPGGGRKYTEEGFPIYTEDELGLNKKGGDTPDCPFDCQCCF